MQSASWKLGGSSSASLIARKHADDDSEFDVTPMVDLVFMMNIYFLVAFLTAALGEVDLPSAAHVVPLDVDSAVVLTVLDSFDDDLVTDVESCGTGHVE